MYWMLMLMMELVTHTTIRKHHFSDARVCHQFHHKPLFMRAYLIRIPWAKTWFRRSGLEGKCAILKSINGFDIKI